jgi:predicted metal-dependent HD superfamily phosphohydrolase
VDENRWFRLMAQLSLSASPEVYQQLRAAYVEPQRFYHTADHITDCLYQLDWAAHLAQARAEVELALWFHDAIYQPQAEDNELSSAVWAVQFIQSVDASPAAQALSRRIYQQILATQHQDPVRYHTLSGDAALVVDIDLSILGRDAEVFEQFERHIRQEYGWVPEPLYCQRRSAVLAAFLERPRIFTTAYFHTRYEKKARENLNVTLERLMKKSQ